jgi:uncharacterized protein (TIGR03118 family)
MQVCRVTLAACLGLVLLMLSAPAQAQYRLTILDSNQLGLVNHGGNGTQHVHVDPLLANPWGLARSATGPWYVPDNDTGWTTLYNATGGQIPLRILIPTAGSELGSAQGGNGPGTPTGIVFNGSSDFQIQGMPAVFLFDTLDGTISGYVPAVNPNQALIAVDNSAGGALYQGLAITSYPSGNFLYAADNANNVIDMYDGNFNLVKSFGDPNIPSTFSVFNVQDINGMVYVCYAKPNYGSGGYVDLFTENGVLVKTLIQGLPLNQAWGVALAPSNFGPLSNTLLISNNSYNGTINGFDPNTGKFVGTIKDQKGKQVILNNLWGIAFGGGNSSSGATNELFVTVGNGDGSLNELAGTFLSIEP